MITIIVIIINYTNDNDNNNNNDNSVVIIYYGKPDYVFWLHILLSNATSSNTTSLNFEVGLKM